MFLCERPQTLSAPEALHVKFSGQLVCVPHMLAPFAPYIIYNLEYVSDSPLGLPSSVVRPNGLCASRWGFETQRLRECFFGFLGFR